MRVRGEDTPYHKPTNEWEDIRSDSNSEWMSLDNSDAGGFLSCFHTQYDDIISFSSYSKLGDILLYPVFLVASIGTD